MNTGSALRAALVSLAALSLGGCVPTAAQAGDQAVFGDISAAQAAELADGDVTSAEYHEAFRRYSSCLSEAGFELLLNGEVNGVLDFGIPAAAVDAGVDATCYNAEFQQVDIAWQLANQDTSEGTAILRDCLVNNGITPKETTEEIMEQLSEAGISIDECAG